MKRAVLCVDNPEDYLTNIDNYSIMLINPQANKERLEYLLSRSDYSMLITKSGTYYQSGNDYKNEKLFWYTSGTTGDSKFYSFTQDQLNFKSEQIVKDYQLTKKDHYVSLMPLWHGHGQSMFWAAHRAGCQITCLEIKNIRQLEKLNPTFISATPNLLKIIAELDIKTLRFIRNSSQALPEQLYHTLKEKFKVPIIETFGMTETMGHCFTNPLYKEQRVGTVGLPTGIEAKIKDQRLYLRGPTVFKSGWYETGDLAEQDSAGYYRILGRSIDQINVNGFKLNPASLEQQLLDTIPGLLECAVFGTNQVKCIFVGTCSIEQVNLSLLGIGKHCRPELVKSVEFIPTTQSGKISRIFLNSLF